MPAGEEKPDRHVPVDDQWTYPGRRFGAKGDGADDDEEAVPVELGRMLPTDGEMVCARLVSVGIPCGLATEPIEGAAPIEPGLVAVLVRTADLEAAQDFLSRPLELEEHEERESKADLFTDQDYVHSWICPKCRRGKLELLPYPKKWRRLRELMFTIIAVPPVIMFLLWAFPIPTPTGPINSLPGEWQIAWLAATVVLVIWLFWISANVRVKCCGECGWRSDG